MRGVACEGLEVLSLRDRPSCHPRRYILPPDVGRFSKEGSE